MRYLICGRGDLHEFAVIPELERRNLGIELQSYGLDAVISGKEWRNRLALHLAFRERFNGYLAVHGLFIGLFLTQKNQPAPIHSDTLDLRANLKWISEHLPDVNISHEMIAQPALRFDQINQIYAITQP